MRVSKCYCQRCCLRCSQFLPQHRQQSSRRRPPAPSAIPKSPSNRRPRRPTATTTTNGGSSSGIWPRKHRTEWSPIWTMRPPITRAAGRRASGRWCDTAPGTQIGASCARWPVVCGNCATTLCGPSAAAPPPQPPTALRRRCASAMWSCLSTGRRRAAWPPVCASRAKWS